MKDTEFAYAVARVRCNEASLLSSSFVESLISTQNYAEAVKLLSESGFGDFEKTDADVILSERLEKAFRLIYESAPDKNCLDFLIVKNDFHNIKAAIKCLLMNTSAEKLFLSPSVVKAGDFVKALENKDFDGFEHGFGEILKEAYAIVTETMDGQLLEVYLDRKCIEKSVFLAEKSGDEFSKALAVRMAVLANIKIALRCSGAGKDEAFIKNALCDIEGFDKKELCAAALEGVSAVSSFVKGLGFEKLSEALVIGSASFEKACDDMLIDMVKSAKYQCLGISPLVAYYFATDAEVKTVRIILSCKKNGIDNEIIRERVRVLYV
jgi:V/A-type H+-transporting ATPase subunit C